MTHNKGEHEKSVPAKAEQHTGPRTVNCPTIECHNLTSKKDRWMSQNLPNDSYRFNLKRRVCFVRLDRRCSMEGEIYFHVTSSFIRRYYSCNCFITTSDVKKVTKSVSIMNSKKCGLPRIAVNVNMTRHHGRLKTILIRKIYPPLRL